MSESAFAHEDFLRMAKLKPQDIVEINKRRRDNNRLGFAYQLAFVRLHNRFPTQQPLETLDELLTYVAIQLDIPETAIVEYQRRRQTIAEHRATILNYLGLRSYSENEMQALAAFLFEEACRLEQTGPLVIQAKQFLKENGILFPADDTLRRLIVTQRQAARDHIFSRITANLPPAQLEALNDLLITGKKRTTPFQVLKKPPGQPSPKSMLRLADKLKIIQATGILAIDLSWLRNGD